MHYTGSTFDVQNEKCSFKHHLKLFPRHIMLLAGSIYLKSYHVANNYIALSGVAKRRLKYAIPERSFQTVSYIFYCMHTHVSKALHLKAEKIIFVVNGVHNKN